MTKDKMDTAKEAERIVFEYHKSVVDQLVIEIARRLEDTTLGRSKRQTLTKRYKRLVELQSMTAYGANEVPFIERTYINTMT